MFPSWSGWYSNGCNNNVPSEENADGDSISQVDELKSQLGIQILIMKFAFS